jgi:sulfur relay protein TusB/DsrH
MSKKEIVIVVKSKPFSNIKYYEALRIAAGLWEHKVTLIWMGDGVYAVLKNADKTLTSPLLKEFPGLDFNLYVEAEGLDARGFRTDDIIQSVKVINRDKIAELLLKMEASLVC